MISNKYSMNNEKKWWHVYFGFFLICISLSLFMILLTTRFNVIAISILVGLIISILILFKPEMGVLGSILLTMVFSPLTTLYVHVVFFNIYAIEGLLTITIMSVIINNITYPKKYNLEVLSYILIVGFILYGFVPLVVGMKNNGFQIAFNEYRRIMPMVVFVFIIPAIFNSYSKIIQVIVVILLSGCINVIQLMFGYLIGEGKWNEVAGYTIIGSSQAIFIAYSVLLSIAILMMVEKARFRKILWITCVIEIIFVIFSFSRAAWLGTFAGIFMLYFYSDRKIKFIAITLGIFSFAVIAIYAAELGGYTSNFPVIKTTIDRAVKLGSEATYFTDRNILIREAMWMKGIEMIKQKPFFGWGFGYPWDFWVPTVATGRPEYLRLHSTFIDMAISMGLIGFLYWATIVIKYFMLGLKKIKEIKIHSLKACLLGILSCFLVFLVSYSTGSAMEQFYLFPYLWIFPGIIIAIYKVSCGKPNKIIKINNERYEND